MNEISKNSLNLSSPLKPFSNEEKTETVDSFSNLSSVVPSPMLKKAFMYTRSNSRSSPLTPTLSSGGYSSESRYQPSRYGSSLNILSNCSDSLVNFVLCSLR